MLDDVGSKINRNLDVPGMHLRQVERRFYRELCGQFARLRRGEC